MCIRDSQYAQAQISCTADEQLRRDEEFNWLMQCGTVVRAATRNRYACEAFTEEEAAALKLSLIHI